MHGLTPEQHTALFLRCLETVRGGLLACLRCGGSGIYAHYGTCFRCGGARTDPKQPKNPSKSRTLARQREWAARFDANGQPIQREPMPPAVSAEGRGF